MNKRHARGQKGRREGREIKTIIEKGGSVD